MTATTNHTAIGPLVLVRLLAAGEKGESASTIQKDLEPLLAHRWSGVPLTVALNHAVEELKTVELVRFLPGKSRKAATKIALTAEGRQRGLEFLRLANLPAKPKPTWANLKKIWLVARAMGLPSLTDRSTDQFARDNGFKGALLKQQFNLPTHDIPTLDDAIDALTWKLIGFEGETRKFNVKNLKTAVLNRELGDGRATDFKKAASRLVANRSARGATTRRSCGTPFSAVGSTRTAARRKPARPGPAGKPARNCRFISRQASSRWNLLRNCRHPRSRRSRCQNSPSASRPPHGPARPADTATTRCSSCTSGGCSNRTPTSPG